MAKRIRTKAELIEFFSLQTLIMYVIKEQKRIATWHSLTPHPARSWGGGGGGHTDTRVLSLRKTV